MKRKSYRKGAYRTGGANEDENMDNNEPANNAPANNAPANNAPVNNAPANNAPVNNEPKKYVDPTGKEWCECPPPKTMATRLDAIKNIGTTANQAVVDFQDNAINKVKNTFSETKGKLQDGISSNLSKLGNIFKKDDVPVAVPNANEAMAGGRRRRTRKHKHKHSKHSKNKHSKHCTRKTHCKRKTNCKRKTHCKHHKN
jgi:hypothetical protein